MKSNALQSIVKMTLDAKLAKIRSPNLESQAHVSIELGIFPKRPRLTIKDCGRPLIDRRHTSRTEREELAHCILCSPFGTSETDHIRGAANLQQRPCNINRLSPRPCHLPCPRAPPPSTIFENRCCSHTHPVTNRDITAID